MGSRTGHQHSMMWIGAAHAYVQKKLGIACPWLPDDPTFTSQADPVASYLEYIRGWKRKAL